MAKKKTSKKGRKKKVILSLSILTILILTFSVIFVVQTAVDAKPRPATFVIWDDVTEEIEGLECIGETSSSPQWEFWRTGRNDRSCMTPITNSDGMTLTASGAVNYLGFLGTANAVNHIDLTGRDARFWIDYGFTAGRNCAGGGASHSGFAKIAIGNLVVNNPNVVASPCIVSSRGSAVIDIIHPDYFKPEFVEIRVNGDIKASGTITGPQNLHISTGSTGTATLTVAAYPYITIPAGACTTEPDESLVIQRFSLDKNGDFIDIATTEDDLATSDFKFPATRFCEVHSPILVLGNGASSEMTGDQTITFYNALATGEPQRLTGLQDIVLVYKAKSDLIEKDCKDDKPFYDADVGECVASIMDTIIIEPEVISEEQASAFVDLFEFEIPGEKQLRYTQRWIELIRQDDGEDSYFERTENLFLMDKHEVKTDFSYNRGASGCPTLPGDGNVGIGTRTSSVLLQDLPDNCVRLEFELNGKKVTVDNNARAKLDENWDVSVKITGKDSGGDALTFRDYSYDITLIQTLPVCRMTQIDVPENIVLNSGAAGVMTLGCDLDGTAGYNKIESNDASFPGITLDSEIYNVDVGENKIPVILQDDTLLAKNGKVDHWLKASIQNRALKFKMGQGSDFTYTVVESIDDVSDEDKVIIDEGEKAKDKVEPPKEGLSTAAWIGIIVAIMLVIIAFVILIWRSQK